MYLRSGKDALTAEPRFVPLLDRYYLKRYRTLRKRYGEA